MEKDVTLIKDGKGLISLFSFSLFFFKERSLSCLLIERLIRDLSCIITSRGGDRELYEVMNLGVILLLQKFETILPLGYQLKPKYNIGLSRYRSLTSAPILSLPILRREVVVRRCFFI